MARVLIAWELGEALGHLARCLRLAHGLAARGHAVTPGSARCQAKQGRPTLAGLPVLGLQSLMQAPAGLDAEVPCVAAGMSQEEAKHYFTQLLLAGLLLAIRPRLSSWRFLPRVESSRAGKLLGGRIDAVSVTASLQELLGNPAYRQAARAFRSRHADFSPGQAIEQSLFLIERVSRWLEHTDRSRKSPEPQ